MRPFYKNKAVGAYSYKHGHRNVQREVVLLCGAAVYARIGNVTSLSLLGIPVYRRVGTMKNILGFRFGANA